MKTRPLSKSTVMNGRVIWYLFLNRAQEWWESCLKWRELRKLVLFFSTKLMPLEVGWIMAQKAIYTEENYDWFVQSDFKSIWKTGFILIWRCRKQRKIRCVEQDSNSHLRVSRRLSLRTRSVSILFQNHPQRYEKLDLVFHISEDGSEIKSICTIYNTCDRVVWDVQTRA